MSSATNVCLLFHEWIEKDEWFGPGGDSTLFLIAAGVFLGKKIMNKDPRKEPKKVPCNPNIDSRASINWLVKMTFLFLHLSIQFLTFLLFTQIVFY